MFRIVFNYMNLGEYLIIQKRSPFHISTTIYNTLLIEDIQLNMYEIINEISLTYTRILSNL